ncbi:MAG: SGNH/GDSL hydrolase family protein [Myxococcota bacterium]
MTRARTGLGERIGTACSAILACVALVCGALAAFVLVEREAFLTGARETAFFLGLPLVVGAGALAGTRLAVERRLQLLLLLISTIVSLLAAELYLVALESYRANVEAREIAAAVEEDKRSFADYDERSTRQFFADQWAQGNPVYPRIYQLSSRTLAVDGQSVFPTSNLSDRRIVECFADGRYKVYLSDEYGFANPRGLLTRDAEIVLVGDSFTAGECVSTDQDIAAQLRQSHPASVSLGIGGAGPLWELANLVEYGLPLRPRTVFWLYYEGNDLADLTWEARVPELTRYLASQESLLRRNKAEVDARVAELQTREIESLREIKPTAATDGRPLRAWLQTLKLSNLRRRLGLRRDDSSEEQARIETLERVIVRARTLVERQGGRFVLVYVPDYSRWVGGSVGFDRGLVLEMLRRNDVRVLDLLPALEAHPDVLSLYPHRRMGHFNAAGYAFIAEQLLAELPRD